MGHTLTLEIPEEAYKLLLKKAREAGRTPEEMASACLSSAIQTLTDDPLLQLAGTFESAVTDMSEGHDDYIGQGQSGRRR